MLLIPPVNEMTQRRIKKLTQFTMGGNRVAEIATPINGPALPCRSAKATPEPDGRAQRAPIHNDRGFPLQQKLVF